MGVGTTKTDIIFNVGRGLNAAATATGATAKEPLSNVFRLSAQTGENIFNISVNGVNGIIECRQVPGVWGQPSQKRWKHGLTRFPIRSPVSIGGATVRYSATSNNLTFTTGTTGSDPTIKVKGAAVSALMTFPSVWVLCLRFTILFRRPMQMVQLYVDQDGRVVESLPENLVEGYTIRFILMKAS